MFLAVSAELESDGDRVDQFIFYEQLCRFWLKAGVDEDCKMAFCGLDPVEGFELEIEEHHLMDFGQNFFLLKFHSEGF